MIVSGTASVLIFCFTQTSIVWRQSSMFLCISSPAKTILFSCCFSTFKAKEEEKHNCLTISSPAYLEHSETRVDIHLDAPIPWQPSKLCSGAALCLALPGALKHHSNPHYALHGRVVHERWTWPDETLQDSGCSTGLEGFVYVAECHTICICDRSSLPCLQAGVSETRQVAQWQDQRTQGEWKYAENISSLQNNTL